MGRETQKKGDLGAARAIVKLTEMGFDVLVPLSESTMVMKECKKHGMSERYLNGKYWRCKQCNAEAVTVRRKKVRALLVEYKGGACEDCGIRDIPAIYDFHHLDPSKKDFTVARRPSGAIEKLKIEADKCALLCSNCHRKRHVEEYLRSLD